MLKLVLKGLRDVRARSAVRKEKLAKLSGAHLKAAIVIHGWVMRNFKTEGGMHDRANLRWPALAESTIQARLRRKQWPGLKLQVNGTLRMGFVPSGTMLSGKVENYVPYARYHEEGTKRMPMRKMFPSERQAYDLVRPIFRDHVRVSIK